MQGKKSWTTKSQLDDGQLEKLVERGRQLHDRAVFDLLAWMAPTLIRSARQYSGKDRAKKEKLNYSEKMFLKHTSKIPA